MIRGLWTEHEFSYQGEFYTLTEAYCSPKPVQSPPRIWLGTLGERKGLQLAGEVADAWNCSLQPAEVFARKREGLLSNASNPSSFLTSVNVAHVPAPQGNFEEELVRRFGGRAEQVRDNTLTGSAEQMRDMVMPYVEAGADWVLLSIRPPYDLAELARFAEDVAGPIVGRSVATA